MKRVLSAGDIVVQLEMTAVTTTEALLSSKRVAVIRGRKGVSSTLLLIALLNLRPALLQWRPVERSLSPVTSLSLQTLHDTTLVADSDCLSQLRKTVDQLSSVVQPQQATINKLTGKLKFI